MRLMKNHKFGSTRTDNNSKRKSKKNYLTKLLKVAKKEINKAKKGNNEKTKKV